MITINIIFIVSLVVVAFIGYFIGLGKALKWATKGIFGIAISVIACFMLGGSVKSVGVVSEFIEGINAYFGGLWNFLGMLHLGTIVYYICFFFVVQIMRIFIVRIVGKLDDIENKVFRFINKMMGGVLLSAFCFALLLLGLAGVKAIETTSFAINLLEKIDGSYIMTLYLNNPIVF